MVLLIRSLLLFSLLVYGEVACVVVRAQQGVEGDTIPASTLPRRTIPDTRGLNQVLWYFSVLDQFAALEERSVRSGLEEALCLYGTVVRPNVIIIEEAVEPTEVFEQSATSVTTLCPGGDYFVGPAHTHLTPLGQGVLDSDAFHLRTDNVALLVVAIAEGYLMWATREQTMVEPWNYQRHRRPL